MLRTTYLVEVDGQLSFPDQEKSDKLSIEIKKIFNTKKNVQRYKHKLNEFKILTFIDF